jgi:hypothetical protein
MYADDVQLYISSERSDISCKIEKLNLDLVGNWSVQNGLCLRRLVVALVAPLLMSYDVISS